MTRSEELELKKKELNAKLAEIEKEEQQIAQEELRIRKQEAAEFIEKLRENKDFILSLFEHERTSCSDAHIANGYMSSCGYARCTKCFLTELLNGEWGDDVFEIHFELSIEEIK